MNLDPALLNSLVLLLSGFGAAFLAALWISLIIWTYRDVQQRTTDRLARILAILLTALLNLPGLLLYLLLRPPQTLERPTSAPWKRKSSCKRWRPNRNAPAAGGRSLRNGCSAPTATPASKNAAPLAHAC